MLRLYNNPIELLGVFVAFLVAITVHEFAHAWSSDRLGDPTSRLMGRLSLNPLAHLDPIGTLMILFAPIGWAKPVQIDPFNLRNPRRDSAIIALSGPAANLITAFILSILYRILSGLLIAPQGPAIVLLIFIFILQKIIILNVTLAIFNLIPIHPLDGFSVVRGILPEEYAKQWAELESYGIIFLLFLIFPLFGGASPIWQFMSPIINFLLNIFLPKSPGII